MRLTSYQRSTLATAAVVGAFVAGDLQAEAASFTQTNLVSDIPSLAALTDANLKNPWGMSDLGGSPFWVSNQVTNTSTLYAVHGTNVSPVGLVVSTPTTASGPQGPTGQASNPDPASFLLNGTRSLFIFANLNGTISAWNGTAGTSAVVEATTSGAVYTGLAVVSSQAKLLAADNANGKIDAFDANFAPMPLSGAFDTPAAIAKKGFVPFNVQDIGGKVFVTYAPVEDGKALAGQGAIAEFTEAGALTKTIIGGPLASPWGLAMAPAGLPGFGGDLFIGNESAADPGVTIFDPTTGKFVGSFAIDPGKNNTVSALWGLSFGFGNNGGDPNTLYFVDGINEEQHGLFGAVTIAVPETSTWAMILAGFAAVAFAARRRSLRARASLA